MQIMKLLIVLFSQSSRYFMLFLASTFLLSTLLLERIIYFKIIVTVLT
jgi:hypothetical protein